MPKRKNFTEEQKEGVVQPNPNPKTLTLTLDFDGPELRCKMSKSIYIIVSGSRVSEAPSPI